MSDRVLVIGWGVPVRGAEERGLEVFNEALGLLGRMQQEGRIESFDVCLFEPNTQLNGLVLIRGSVEQINALREDPDFRRNTADAQLIVENLHHLTGRTNEGIAEMMGIYQQAIATVPQRA